ncbi:MAG: GIY-YIG nuclease family protein, partial [Lachnospiraceae bacterium]|nr:GIY-YIG nuclease family protein [Lachnospiraceae bacterium]
MGIFDIFRISQIKKENADLRAANAEMIRVKQENENLTASLFASKKENEVLLASNEEMARRANESGITEYYQAKERIDAIEAEITSRTSTITQLREENESLQEKQSKLEHSLASSQKKLSRSKELYKSINYSVENFFNSDDSQPFHSISAEDSADLDLIAPSVELKLHCMDMKSLRQAYRENEKVIKDVLARYSSRYTTKANRTIYDLMVIALQAELQNILTALKYDKLDRAVDNVKTVTAKYLKIAAEGNQSIAGTLTKFIGEIEYLFINAVKIEYNYYVKKEQAKQEQLEIRQKMREEAEERKALEAERKKIEKEESKFHTQIAALTEQANASSGDELEALRARILELQSQLADVVVKKEEISNLQNGKAGNVYIISN